jgi:hypothetical protein
VFQRRLGRRVVGCRLIAALARRVVEGFGQRKPHYQPCAFRHRDVLSRRRAAASSRMALRAIHGMSSNEVVPFFRRSAA